MATLFGPTTTDNIKRLTLSNNSPTTIVTAPTITAHAPHAQLTPTISQLTSTSTTNSQLPPLQTRIQTAATPSPRHPRGFTSTPTIPQAQRHHSDMAVKRSRTSRDRANSTSTTQSDRPDSVFSEIGDQDSSATTSPATSLMDDFDIIEIDKKTFEANTRKRKRAPAIPAPKIIKGSTYGGIDPLHKLLKSSGIEPTHWREERYRKEAAARYVSKASKQSKSRANSTPPAKYLRPEQYEKLPFSPQEYFTSGLDLNSEPETRESFWRRVKKGWETSCRRESVEARRKRFGKL